MVQGISLRISRGILSPQQSNSKMSMFENIDEVISALDKINFDIRGDVQCDSPECEVACTASHSETLFDAYYVKATKRVMGTDFKDLFKITNFLSSQINVLMEKRDYDNTRQVAEEAASSIVTGALATLQTTLTQRIDALAKSLDEKIQTIVEDIRPPVLGNEDSDQLLIAEPVLKPVSRYSVMVELPAKIDGETIPITQEEWKTVEPKLKKSLDSVKVNTTSRTKNERVTLTFPDEKNKDEALTALSTKPEFKTTDTSKQEKRTILPKIKIIDIDEDMFLDDSSRDNKSLEEDREEGKRLFMEKMKNKNKHLEEMFEKNETFDIVYMSKRDKTVVIKVSPVFRDFLKKHGDQLHLGLKISEIRDHFSPTQCYHCQGFGHRVGSPRCPAKNEPPTCMYCSKKGHRSKKCSSKDDSRKRRCINCSSSSDPALRSGATSHNSSSDTCPLMIRQTRTLMNKTLATNESKNEYLRKIMLKKEQQRCFQRY